MPDAVKGNDSDLIESANQDNYGRPHKVDIKEVPNSTRQIAFGLITDTHIDIGNCSFDGDHGNTDRARNLVKHLNRECEDCLGVIHLGDMVDGNNTQYIVAFRQIFEDDYPGHDGGAIAGCDDDDHQAYSKGDRIDFPVFPTLGNHDVPPFSSHDENWRKAQDYIEDRIIGAGNLMEHYKEVNYVWRWGEYILIQLGQWAGSYEHEDNDATDMDKLFWLRQVLEKHVGNSGKGVFIFQHYGWDGFSRDSRWWHADQRDLELDVLCRRLDKDDPCVPYNILAIITGHNHGSVVKHINAGKDLKGEDVIFSNFVLQASGAEHNGHYGFSVVNVDGENLQISSKDLKSGIWSTTEPIPIELGNVNEPDSFRFSVGKAIDSHGETQDWVSRNRPFSGDTEFGGGVAKGDIDMIPHPNPTDIVLVGIDSRPGTLRFYYRIGFNESLAGDQTFDSWSTIKFSPAIGSLSAGAGAALADIDNSGRPDLILMYVDAPDGPDQFRYMIGWNLNTEGDPEHWSELVHGPSPGHKSAGGGADIADFDGNGRPDLLLMALDDPDGPNQFRYTIAWNLNAEGVPEGGWSDIAHGPAPGNSTSGGGVAIDDIDGDGSLDLLFMSVDNPKGPNEYRYLIGWDLDENGQPGSWSDLLHGPSPGSRSCGGGATLFYSNAGFQQGLFMMSLDDPFSRE